MVIVIITCSCEGKSIETYNSILRGACVGCIRTTLANGKLDGTADSFKLSGTSVAKSLGMKCRLHTKEILPVGNPAPSIAVIHCSRWFASIGSLNLGEYQVSNVKSQQIKCIKAT